MDEEAVKKFQGESAEDLSVVSGSPGPEEVGNQAEGNMYDAEGMMSVESLPEDVKGQLPEEAYPIFVAAFNSIFETQRDRDAAMKVAWQTIEHNQRFVKGSDGKWQHQPTEKAEHNPSPKSAA